MDKIKWCCKQKKGIRLIEPNENISESYIKKAEDSLSVMLVSPSKEWKIITAYYACYNCLYGLLQRTGIKSEIHECTLALMPFFNFSSDEIKFIKNLKEKRINVQYHNLEESIVEEKRIKYFILRCKEMLHKSDFEKIRDSIYDVLK